MIANARFLLVIALLLSVSSFAADEPVTALDKVVELKVKDEVIQPYADAVRAFEQAEKDGKKIRESALRLLDEAKAVGKNLKPELRVFGIEDKTEFGIDARTQAIYLAYRKEKGDAEKTIEVTMVRVPFTVDKEGKITSKKFILNRLSLSLTELAAMQKAYKADNVDDRTKAQIAIHDRLVPQFKDFEIEKDRDAIIGWNKERDVLRFIYKAPKANKYDRLEIQITLLGEAELTGYQFRVAFTEKKK